MVTGRKLIYIGLVESEDRRAQSTSDIALTLVRVVKEPDFQRNLTVRAEINALDHLAGGPVPDVQVSAVMTCTCIIIIIQFWQVSARRRESDSGNVQHLIARHHCTARYCHSMSVRLPSCLR